MGIIKTYFDKANDLTVNVATGKITANEIFDAAQTYLVLNPTSKVLWNCLEADGGDITIGDFRTFHIKISRLQISRTIKKLLLLFHGTLDTIFAAYLQSAQRRRESALNSQPSAV
jgi:hypothetical protein